MSLRSLKALVDAGLVPPERVPELLGVVERFAVGLTPTVVEQIRQGSQGIARQYLPQAAELQIQPQELSDPIGDGPHSPLPGVVRRYPDRALLKPVHVCPVYCRFCFRREQVGPEGEVLHQQQLAAALDWIEGQPGLREVILSGGDPLVLSDGRLAPILARLGRIEHLELVRVHTRIPVVQPERVTSELAAILRGQPGLTPWLVVHVNHPDELDPAASEAIGRLVDAGIPLLSQSVLLAGINDSADTLEALFRRLLRLRVKPYYLHQGDLAPGTGHFRVPIERGQQILRELRGRISGIALPTYILDIPGGHGKVPVGPLYLRPEGDGFVVEDPWGGAHTLAR